MIRQKFTITGQVQGVGFRPFLFRLAHDAALTGTVLNAPEGVLLELQGSTTSVARFKNDLYEKLPPLARIVTCETETLSVLDEETSFSILPSAPGQGHSVLISPDTATCPDCLQDMNDPENRRHLYAFTNCTNCGPRYTITKSIPYDRDKTSMACFPLCPDCRKEYEDPFDRRFHAQPNACPVCGPQTWLTNANGTELSRNIESIRDTARLLSRGQILAIKGLGGFHLACAATNPGAVHRLRTRKNRWGKPLAVMVPDLNTARMVADISDADADLLTGTVRPIVLLPRLKNSVLAPDLSPDTSTIGVMLPYTPLHHVLLTFYTEACPAGTVPALVMTSGNLSSEPISLGNREALKRLCTIADNFLLHNRDILIRCDDSVVRTNGEGVQFFRRARGYVPSPIFLHQKGPCVLGTGPLLKNTICLTKGDQAFMSQHIGDLENLETYSFFKEIISHLSSILQVTPEAVVCDLHPDYMSTRYALEESGLPVIQVQHHVAHIHSVMAENRFTGKMIGLALDGTGFGEDGTLWGGELLLVDNEKLTHERLGHFTQTRLPGGEAAIREPWRLARSVLHDLGIADTPGDPWPWLPQEAEADEMVVRMLSKKFNTPLTSSCGRLFDAVSALLGLKLRIDYEGQAAIILEDVQDMTVSGSYPCPVLETGDRLVLDTRTLFRHIVEARRGGEPIPAISRRFHTGLMHGLRDWTVAAAEKTDVRTVGLSGGVMQNRTLTQELPELLRRAGFTVLTHTHVPPGDACISLGQAAYGRQKLQNSRG